MVTDFLTWLNEGAVNRLDYRKPEWYDDSLPQQEGDVVFFGLNALNKYQVRAGGRMPMLSIGPYHKLANAPVGNNPDENEWLPTLDIKPYLGKILKVDNKEQTIFQTKKPSSRPGSYLAKDLNIDMGDGTYPIYLGDKIPGTRRRKTDEQKHKLRDVTEYIIPEHQPLLKGHKVWLFIAAIPYHMDTDAEMKRRAKRLRDTPPPPDPQADFDQHLVNTIGLGLPQMDRVNFREPRKEVPGTTMNNYLKRNQLSSTSVESYQYYT